MSADTRACPTAFALRNFDRNDAIEGNFTNETAAVLKAIKLRKADGQVRGLVGLDAAGNAWTVELAGHGHLHATKAKPSHYRLIERIGKPARRAHLTLVK
jgi:hypothetical protein